MPNAWGSILASTLTSSVVLGPEMATTMVPLLKDSEDLSSHST